MEQKNNKQKVIDQLQNDPLMPIRHTAEHVLHTAMMQLYPNIKRVMGPPIENGFYFDFDLDESISPEDFAKIEALMQKIIDANLEMKRLEVSADTAKKIFKNNTYKIENIEAISERGESITLYEMGINPYESDFIEGEFDYANAKGFYDLDLCAGPHTKKTSDIKAFKLLSVAGAYYKGDEKNKMLQRIYGTAFASQEDLTNYLAEIERKKENDHRKLNEVLDIFATSDLVGKGLIMYTPNGTIIKNQLKHHLISTCKKYGAKEVDIPHFAKIDLYKTSGHAEKFKEELFRVISHYDEEFVLKPVNCPHHTQIYASRPRSYKDLPLAYVESTQQHRDEKPGAMVGLNRARSFEIDDGHTFCTPEQLKSEVTSLIHMIRDFYTTFDMWGKHWVSLSFRDASTPEKYIGSDEDWQKAQNTLLEINDELNLGGKVMEGEAALYGPKLDIMLKDALGNDRQLGTVQIDYAMPKRFGLTYIDRDGAEKTPVMIHRAILGSYHRFIANLLESTGGALPVWLSPTQVEIITISDEQVEYAKKIQFALREKDIRADLNDKNETMQAKIRDAQLRKVPYMLIIGAKEATQDMVSVRLRSGENLGVLSLDAFLKRINGTISSKSLEI